MFTICLLDAKFDKTDKQFQEFKNKLLDKIKDFLDKENFNTHDLIDVNFDVNLVLSSKGKK